MSALAQCLEEAREALRSGDAPRAEAICQLILRRFPRQIEGNCLLAEAARDQGRLDEARERFQAYRGEHPELDFDDLILDGGDDEELRDVAQIGAKFKYNLARNCSESG